MDTSVTAVVADMIDVVACVAESVDLVSIVPEITHQSDQHILTPINTRKRKKNSSPSRRSKRHNSAYVVTESSDLNTPGSDPSYTPVRPKTGLLLSSLE